VRNNRGRNKTWQVSFGVFAFFSINSCAYGGKESEILTF
jgi:hypothetical protein